MKSYGVTIQMKATEQYFPVVLLIMLYKVVLAFESEDEILSVTTQMKATEQHFSVVLFIMLYFFFFTAEVSACLFIFLGITIAIFQLGFTILKVKF